MTNSDQQFDVWTATALTSQLRKSSQTARHPPLAAFVSEQRVVNLPSGVTSRNPSTHNTGGCPHTVDGRPWLLDVIVEFSDEKRAAAFERYLKSGSGWAFAKRHLRYAVR